MNRGFDRSDLEYAICRTCDGAIVRCQGGLWEHAIDVRLDWDHFPLPETSEQLTMLDEVNSVREAVLESFRTEPDHNVNGHRRSTSAAINVPANRYL